MKLIYVLSLSLFVLAASFALKTIENGFTKKRDDPKVINISVIDSENADLLFREFVQNKNIPFRYPRDGCYARATAMALMAEKSSVIMGKIYAKGLLVAKTKIPKYPIAIWGWHVAPVTFVKKIDGLIELMVFDPSLFSKPVTTEEWKNKMKEDIGIKGEKGQVDEIYYGSRFQYTEKSEEYKDKWLKADLENMTETFSTYLPLQDSSSSSENKNIQDPVSRQEGSK